MASTPTSKSQVQAYQFVLRRMESALVRKDAVMLHDPMRTHKRATVVGVIAGVAILAGFLIVGVLRPATALPTGNAAIVIAQPSGQVYVLDQSPRQLIPVFNVTSARLLLLAMSSGSGASSGSSSAGASASAPTPVQPQTVSDAELAGVPMGRLTGIPDGPPALPSPATSGAPWAICDDVPYDPNNPTTSQSATPTNTVLVGVSNTGDDLTSDKALYATTSDGSQYLIYQTPTDLNQPNDSEVIAKVDNTNNAVLTALFPGGTPIPRHISPALLNAIPSAAEIQDPFKALNIPVGGPGPQGLSGITVGQTFQERNTENGVDNYAVLPNGVEKVSPTVAQILLGANGSGTVSPQAFTNVTKLPGDPLQVASYPGTLPKVLNTSGDKVVCLNWNATPGGSPVIKTKVTVGQNVNLPTGSDRKPVTSVRLGQIGPNGNKIDQFAMDPKALSLGVAVRAVTNAQSFGVGPIMLISPRGTAYSIDTVTTAQALGVASSDSSGAAPFGLFPGPQSIIGLLPVGAETLNTQNVQRTFDSVPVPETAGQYTPVTTTTNGGS
jgi:ESX secretion system ATPase EccB